MSTPARVPRNLLSQSGDPAGPSLIAGDTYFNTTAKTIRIYDGSAWVDLVNDETAQTIAGVKTFSAETIFAAATSSIPSIRIPHGTAPSSPTNGDIWTTTSGLYSRINGVTVGPIETLVPFNFTVPGSIAVHTGRIRLYAEATLTIISVRASLNTAPTGATCIVDVNKNGTTIYTTQGNRPAIAISGNTATANSPDVTSLASGDYLTMDIDQIGSTVQGENLTVQVLARRTG